MTKLEKIFQDFQEKGINSFYVGGCVRDELLDIESDDIDICLVNVSDYKIVTTILEKYSENLAAVVGEQFPVWIATINGIKYDFALARTEKKVGTTRQDFLCETQNVTLEEDLSRRDLTINAIAKDCISGKIIDPFKGRYDLFNGWARPVSSAFKDDSLRVIRAARFIARFNLEPTQTLINVCRKLTPIDLSNDRVGKELEKVLIQAKNPSLFFLFLKDVNWLRYHFSELNELSRREFLDTVTYIDKFSNNFMRACLIGFFLTHFQFSSLLKRITFKSSKVQEQLLFLIGCKDLNFSSLKRIDVCRITRKLRKLDIDYLYLRSLILLVNGVISNDVDFMFLNLNEKDIDPIVTGEMLIESGYVQGKDLGIKKQLLLDLQDKGELTLENWKEYL